MPPKLCQSLARQAENQTPLSPIRAFHCPDLPPRSGHRPTAMAQEGIIRAVNPPLPRPHPRAEQPKGTTIQQWSLLLLLLLLLLLVPPGHSRLSEAVPNFDDSPLWMDNTKFPFYEYTKFPFFNVPTKSPHPSTFTLKNPFKPSVFHLYIFPKIIKSSSFFYQRSHWIYMYDVLSRTFKFSQHHFCHKNVDLFGYKNFFATNFLRRELKEEMSLGFKLPMPCRGVPDALYLGVLSSSSGRLYPGMKPLFGTFTHNLSL
jgi:hypothetical protein